MNRAAKKINVPEITTTYVWRVALCYEALDKHLELLVLCTEQIPGEKFAQAVQETFVVYTIQGKIPEGLPHELDAYIVKMTSCMGLAAGCVGHIEQHGVSIGTLRNGMPVMVNPARLSQLAGLGDDRKDLEREQKKADVSETSRERLKESRKKRESEQASRSGPIYDAMMDTAAHMAIEGDMGSVDETTMQQAVAAVAATNPEVFNPKPPLTEDEKVVEAAEIKRLLSEIQGLTFRGSVIKD